MNLKQASKKIATLGFNIGVNDTHGKFGTIKPEPYPVSGGYFFPHFRDVFIGKCNKGWYITSHIHGTYRRYRERCEPYDFKVANIFGGGKTLKQAVEKFECNFLTKSYNIQK